MMGNQSDERIEEQVHRLENRIRAHRAPLDVRNPPVDVFRAAAIPLDSREAIEAELHAIYGLRETWVNAWREYLKEKLNKLIDHTLVP